MKKNLIGLFSLALVTFGYNSYAAMTQSKFALNEATKMAEIILSVSKKCYK